MSAACTKSSKLIDFSFRFLHSRLATNTFLQKIGVREKGTCTFCHDKQKYLLHLFWESEKSRSFCNDLSKWLQKCHMVKKKHMEMDCLRPEAREL